ncbi:formimidoylglutamase [bacterium]|nr:formimidoylglutamase [bacterium]
MPTRINWCLLGIPDHQGVVHVGGRIGAGLGPSAFREAFSRLKGKNQVRDLCRDLGDVKNLTQNVEENHARAAKELSLAQATCGVSVYVGGGHDHGFSQLQGIFDYVASTKKTKPRIGCMNVDAHLDVRKPDPEITSGSPFYLALEAGILSPDRLIEFGIQQHCNAPALWAYVEKKKVPVVPFEKLRGGKAVATFKRTLSALAKKCDAVVVSFDLDAVAEAFAPGVSAPQAEGFSASEAMEMVEVAGREKKVISLGIFELNPLHDVGGRTARLAAHLAYHFVLARLPSKS